MERQRLILHVGLPKTGTTTIQTWCRRNAETLKEAGVVYPRVSARVPDHPAFRGTLFNPRSDLELNHSALAGEIRAADGALPDPELPLWRAAVAEIRESEAPTAIVSFENLYRADQYRFDALAPLTADLDWAAIIYLRRPEDWVCSLYGQSIRGKLRRDSSFARFADRMSAICVYSRLLESIRDRRPIANLIVRDFHTATASGLVADFFAAAGLEPIRPADDDDGAKNSSPPWWAVLFLHECNRAGLSDETFVEVRKAVMRLLRKGGAPIRPGLHVATPEERERLRLAAAADADRLEALFGVRFPPGRADGEPWRPFDAEDLATIRKALEPRLSATTGEALASALPGWGPPGAVH